METKKSYTARGFGIYKFKDSYNIKCSLQKSSLATDDAIWLGVDNPDAKILASKVKSGGTGWITYPIPEHILINTRMHLTRDQVAELIPILQAFVDTGEV